MKAATVVPLGYTHHLEGHTYYMCLANLMRRDAKYATFFAEQSLRSKAWVIMDNGVVETGSPMPIEDLAALHREFPVDEIILPDLVGQREGTLWMGRRALNKALYLDWGGMTPDFMAVPQGSDISNWIDCLDQMIRWEINSIGISRFAPRTGMESRFDLVDLAHSQMRLLDMKRSVHLLGFQESVNTLRQYETYHPGRIRGVDSGIATFWTAAGMRMLADDPARPKLEVDLATAQVDHDLLSSNIAVWHSLENKEEQCKSPQ